MAKKTDSQTILEDQEQAALFEWVELKKPEFPHLALLHHIPNGGLRHPRVASQLKRQGLKPGVPDLFLPVSRAGYHGLYIELKVGNKKPSDNQIWWLQRLRVQGYAAGVVWGWQKTAEVIMVYLAGNLATPSYENSPSRRYFQYHENDHVAQRGDI